MKILWDMGPRKVPATLIKIVVVMDEIRAVIIDDNGNFITVELHEIQERPNDPS